MGTRVFLTVLSFCLWDHPHAYGDKAWFVINFYPNAGSSPRVWGQAYLITVPFIVYRIIPTRMGTSSYSLQLLQVAEDHPHAYGDKLSALTGRNRMTGSSPRVWGQEFPMTEYKEEDRIIPTRMGTRLKKSRKIAVLQNQPLRFPLTFHRSFV